MKNRRRLLLLVAAGLLAIGGATVLWQEARRPEPCYQGKPLSYWVDDLWADEHSPGPREESIPDPRVAIRQIGATAVPWLLKWIAYQTPPWRERLDVFCSQYRFLNRFVSQDEAESERAEGAAAALEILGPKAAQATPELIRLFNKKSESQWMGWWGWRSRAARAGRALSTVAPEAFPAVLPGLRSTDPGHRLGAAWLLRTAGTNALSALPDLLELFDDADTQGEVSGVAKDAAEELVKAGEAAVPYLQKGLSSRSPTGAAWAADALTRISPEPPANAPMQIAPEPPTNAPAR
jgi:hypothetical protein